MQADVPGIAWTGVSASADGQKLAAVARFAYGTDPQIYTSTNAGGNWTARSAPALPWQSLAGSADGSKLVVSASRGLIYISADSGASWNATASANTNWFSVASSADGSRLFAAVGGYPAESGLIYRSQTIPAPQLNITSFGNRLLLSWVVPSIDFVLQQSANLASANWTDLAIKATLNFTNLQYEVPVPPTNTGRFYRLRAAGD